MTKRNAQFWNRLSIILVVATVWLGGCTLMLDMDSLQGGQPQQQDSLESNDASDGQRDSEIDRPVDTLTQDTSRDVPRDHVPEDHVTTDHPDAVLADVGSDRDVVVADVSKDASGDAAGDEDAQQYVDVTVDDGTLADSVDEDTGVDTGVDVGIDTGDDASQDAIADASLDVDPPDVSVDTSGDVLADSTGDPIDEDVVAEPAVVVGCAAGVTPYDYGTNMQLCDGANQQCTAEALCKSGWHLCTYSEFVARGGATVDLPTTQSYWIAGSMRDGCGNYTAPADRTVLVCGDTRGSNQEFVDTDCQSGASLDRSNLCDIGLATSPSRRVLMGTTTCVPLNIQIPVFAYGAVCCL